MVTLSHFFLADEPDLTGRIQDALSEYGVRADAGAAGAVFAWRMMPKAIASQLSGLLDIGLGDILVGAWKKSYELRQQLQKSAKTPGKETFLQLAEHKIESTHEPYMALLKNGQEVARLPFSISVELTLKGAVLRIRDGAVREVQTGEIEGKGSLKCAGATLVEKEFTPIKLPGTFEVGAEPLWLRPTA